MEAPIASCPGCGAKPAQSAKFCTWCGFALESPPLSAGGSFLREMAGEGRRIVTVLFADVAGFAAMSERFDPEHVSGSIDEFFQVLVDPIHRYGGAVGKFSGDAIMAVFGAPVAHEDDARRALHAAWEMQQNAAEASRRLAERAGVAMRIRVGLNTGLAVYSADGQHKGERTVTGDTVNLAQRLGGLEARIRSGITIEGPAATTTPDGAFRIPDVDPGAASVSIRTSPSNDVMLALPSDVVAGQVRDAGDLRVFPVRWKRIVSNVAADLHHVQVVSPTEAWASGAGGTLLHTTDGATWTQVSNPISGAVTGMRFLNSLTGFLLAPAGLQATNNGGQSWNTSASLGGLSLAVTSAGAFGGSSEALLISRGPLEGVKASLDGQSQIPFDNTGAAGGMRSLFVAGGTLLAEAGNDVFFTSPGVQWAKLGPSGVSFDAGSATNHAIYANSLDDVWVVGTVNETGQDWATVARTTNRGAAWTQVFKTTEISRLLAVRKYGGGMAATGDCGRIFSQPAGKPWRREFTEPFSCDALFDVEFTPDGSAGWAVGAGGRILKYVR